MAADPSHSPPYFYTLNEYFALERAGDARYEYWDGEIVCMSGGSMAHAAIASGMNALLAQKLADGPCQAFTADLAVRTPSLPPYRYADVTVVCGDPKAEVISGLDTLLNPVLIVEVLSPSTERHDRTDKFAAYKKIESFKEYLLVSQHMPHVTHFSRQPDDTWTSKDLAGMSALLHLDSVGCTLSLAETYKGVAFLPS
jgi:Uma2 family endonuclease